uniref:TLDc domain-containing protein n=1 Tax=Attheya septentrionalis TaxID=420275 RepID=A0A7S2UA73_9STRA|mmetsp:Transcript_14120/g.25573  ORF Transcript_14120/g.25573 Transcript_14120/m.25573 type:complete len:309 (+) Transcript_14120:114-1040(+)|eukprot:CAMPEP_0198299100 /NCGR_PEP_ID=MMETSP1449-20131203/43403_1 /TAXON_ID=420275 /ORGANISM="Attheya septentrionalis, Strain CCMP2084" /LENGTH=308 /DNA_ID=CAMNT_0044000547 /DNA_START=43 /DNA_END=969 /DNA_ORIENTATION=+
MRQLLATSLVVAIANSVLAPSSAFSSGTIPRTFQHGTPPSSIKRGLSSCTTAKYRHLMTRRSGWLDNFLPKVDNENADADRRRDFPEQYPATYELLTEPVVGVVKGDNKEASIVRPLLKQTQLEQRSLELVYDARRDGWTAASFHKKVDGKGAAIVLATVAVGESSSTGSNRQRIVGGYNPKGWSSLGGARPSVASFLFYGDEPGTNIQKLRKVGGGGLACARDDAEYGISFGPDGLVIPLQPGKLDISHAAQSKLGTYFERGPEERSSLFSPHGGSATLSSLKVFVGTYAPGEEIPYSSGVLDMTSG